MDELRWFEKVMIHFAGVCALPMVPVMTPITIGILIWYRCQFGKAIARCVTKMYVETIRFVFTHDLARLCDSYDSYEAELWQLL